MIVSIHFLRGKEDQHDHTEQTLQTIAENRVRETGVRSVLTRTRLTSLTTSLRTKDLAGGVCFTGAEGKKMS